MKWHIMLISSILLILFMVFILKNNATLDAHHKIIDAITEYNLACIDAGNLGDMIDFNEMESYDKTLWRLNDWGHTNILPKEKFELVAPYIK